MVNFSEITPEDRTQVSLRADCDRCLEFPEHPDRDPDEVAIISLAAQARMRYHEAQGMLVSSIDAGYANALKPTTARLYVSPAEVEYLMSLLVDFEMHTKNHAGIEDPEERYRAADKAGNLYTDIVRASMVFEEARRS